MLADTTITTLWGVLSASGTTDTVAKVAKNGDAPTPHTIPAHERIWSVAVNVNFAAGDEWQMLVETAGNGAIGLTYFAETS